MGVSTSNVATFEGEAKLDKRSNWKMEQIIQNAEYDSWDFVKSDGDSRENLYVWKNIYRCEEMMNIWN